MYCARLDHFVRINPNGTLSRCGHMVNPAQFSSINELNQSAWLQKVKEKFQSNVWPSECSRCQQTEQESNTSIRLHANKLFENSLPDALQVGGVLDNVCNAACLTCNPDCSTRIGSLTGKVFPIVNNSEVFWSLPQDKILHLDINGGEPSYSKNYKKILQNLPPNLKTLRLNTNCAVVFDEVVDIANRGVEVTVTVSFDGVGPVHELTRWPITWQTFLNNLLTYKSMPIKLNLWTTVSVLNIDDLPNIIAFAKQHNIDHEYAYLKYPNELSVDNTNIQQRQEYIQRQKIIRGIL